MARENIHTVFDRMAAKGLFRSNPANIDSIDPTTGQPAYQGPIPFPKMMYHPTGKMRITTQPEMVATPFGPQMLNEQRALISIIVNNEAEYAARKKDGWHDHPSDAVAAGFTKEEIEAGAVPPPKSAASRMSALEETIKRLEAELKAAKASPSTIQSDEEPEEE